MFVQNSTKKMNPKDKYMYMYVRVRVYLVAILFEFGEKLVNEDQLAGCLHKGVVHWL